MTNQLNAKLKHWSSWFVMLFCVVALMIFGTQRDSGPATPQERIESISKRLACPTCDGESVYESRGGASQAIRKEIARQVADGQLTDSQIVKAIDESYSADLKLVPGSTGFDALIWALPIGYYAVKCLMEINKKFQVEMPIIEAVYNIVYEKISPTIEMRILSDKLS